MPPPVIVRTIQGASRRMASQAVCLLRMHLGGGVAKSLTPRCGATGRSRE
jgi:hypothetical protein